MNIKNLFILVASTLLMVACSGGGSTSTGGHYFSHEELAEEFVYRLNVDIAGYDVELVKTNTDQYDYIVVYDWGLDAYDAYYIGNYNVGENLNSYLISYDSSFYYNLDYLGGNSYVGSDVFGHNVFFDKATDAIKNQSLKQGLKDMAIMNRMAKSIRDQFGLSKGQSMDTARFAYGVQMNPDRYDMSHFDGFALELTGSTISGIQDDVIAGKSLDARLELAEKKMGIGSENVNKFINTVIMGQ